MAQHMSQNGVPAVFRVPRASTVDLIARELRNAIYSGALAVGTQLGEKEIAQQLGVSRSPLREAAQRLVQEGLLTATPGRGLRVSTIRGEQVNDLYVARTAVESEAVRLLINHDDEEAIAGVESALEELVNASRGRDPHSIGDSDLDFHWALVDAAGSQRLRRYMSTLVLETRIASFSVPEGFVVRRNVAASHETILEAIRAGDVETGVAAVAALMDEAVARLTGLEPGALDVETVGEPHQTSAIALEPLSHH
ncbi:GntR family transcriptional regulator [Arthrobacter castelli]|uniref:GntR family transcriptional regulator n=1 Tax=Arthrobacter castelli TaxID=271431 RepID=UPI00041BBC73|nr:GntR family transcriptional regulator [Arthrobacter castelli]